MFNRHMYCWRRVSSFVRPEHGAELRLPRGRVL